MIYLDNAATTLHKPPCVTDAVVNAMQTMGNSGRSAHAESLAASRTIYAAREALAALFGCERADHVCFTANSTEALNIAISGLLAPGDHVLSTDLEHNSVLRPLYREMERGVSVSFLPADRKGCIDYADFDRLLQTNTKAVICTAGSNLTGNLLDLTRIGAFCAAHGLLFVVDASQTAGVFPIDLRAQHISVLCFTGHKSLMGPQGTGGLCVAEGVDIDPVAVRTAGENAALNGVQDKLTVLVGDLSDKASGKYDIITANIVANAILSLAPAVPGLMAEGATFIASGIIDSRKDEVIAALEAAGLTVQEVKEKRGWECIVCKKA